MQIQENIPLRDYNSFRLDVKAEYFSPFSSTDELELLLDKAKDKPLFILGGGSNILLTRDVRGLVLHNRIMGIEELHEDNEHVYVRAGAGENWHGFVEHCISRGWGGVENLSLIPGNVGASPMQNIGAYGVELSLVFYNLEAYHIREGRVHTFTESDCEFGYRESVFKNVYKNEFIILSVTFRLLKRPILHTSYGAIREELEKMGVNDPGIREISQAVISIRRSKLPDPKVIGNAGSFFKNPVIGRTQFLPLKEKFPGIISFENLDGSFKLAAGWLIENSGPGEGVSWKGYREGDAGVHERQALVLVNHGRARGREIYDLSERIKDSVYTRFGVSLEREVNVI